MQRLFGAMHDRIFRAGVFSHHRIFAYPNRRARVLTAVECIVITPSHTHTPMQPCFLLSRIYARAYIHPRHMSCHIYMFHASQVLVLRQHARTVRDQTKHYYKCIFLIPATLITSIEMNFQIVTIITHPTQKK